MKRSIVQALIFSAVLFFLGVGTTAAVIGYIPDPGSPPSIFDDFNWSTTSNGYWHVNTMGAQTIIKDSMLTLHGADAELDRRIQTDPAETDVALKIRGIDFKRFGFGMGEYHAGTLGMEFDIEGIKCGFGSDYGYQVLYVRHFNPPPKNAWYYLEVRIINPYPTPEAEKKVQNLDYSQRKPVTLICSAYDNNGHLVGQVVPKVPPPNAHYEGLDEVYARTWDSHNKYQIDWFYAGPPSGNPLNGIVQKS